MKERISILIGDKTATNRLYTIDGKTFSMDIIIGVRDETTTNRLYTIEGTKETKMIQSNAKCLSYQLIILIFLDPPTFSQ